MPLKTVKAESWEIHSNVLECYAMTRENIKQMTENWTKETFSI